MREVVKDLEKKKRALSEKEFKKIPNPYDPSDFKSGRSYYNKAVVAKLINEFEAAPPTKTIFLQGKVGSGKSSTLNRIRNDSNILGDRYITIYVDINRVIAGSSKSFLSNLYEHLKKSLDMYRFPFFDEQLDALKASVSIEDLRTFFCTLEEQLKSKDSIILLIFDDFDKVFEPENMKMFFHVFRLIKELSKDKNKLRILLTGSRDIPDSVKLTEPESLMKRILHIRMTILDQLEFDKLIVEPVKNQVTYTSDALQEIRKITGGNLYCQQFLCYYIIRYLNEEKEYTCDKEDVTAAAELMINDKREDFEYFWIKKLNWRWQVVCSALVDEEIVSKRSGFYFIEPSSLLENIFDPRELNDIYHNLNNNDIIHKPDGRRFDEFPFKIPLFGKWINLKHPFLKTVVDNIEDIVAQRDFSRLGKISEKIPKELFPKDKSTAIECLRQWFNIQTVLEEKGGVNHEEIDGFVKVICQILEFSVIEESRPAENYYRIDSEKLGIGRIKEAFFLIQELLEPSQTDIKHLVDTILPHVQPTRPCLFFCFKKNDQLEELEKKTFLNIIFLEGEDLKNFIFSPWPKQILKDILFQRIPSVQISPYQTEGPSTTIFYGRHKELRRILTSVDESFIIVGARRIGKSSLTMRVKDELDDLGIYSFYMDIEYPKDQDYKTFLTRIEQEFKKRFKRNFHFNESLDNFVREIKELDIGNKRLVLILDEIDELLKFDQNNDYELLRAFRMLFHERCCQIILSGFEVLYNSIRDIKSPLYNFGGELKLGPLEEDYALDLITEPMRNIGINYENPEVRHLILGYTSCHPNLLQFFCKQLIEKISERETNKRTIFKTDIEELFNVDYDKYILNDFYMFYDDLDDLEKLIVLLLAKYESKKNDYSFALINQKLKESWIDLLEGQINKTIQKLVLRFILIDKGQGRYAFALPQFPAMIKKRSGTDLLESLIKRVKKEYDYG
jgi:Cdc6-like AAA superfamily ATPase